MGKFKEFLAEKAIGFYITLGAAVLSLITAVVYVICFSAMGAAEFISWAVFAFLLVACIITLALLILPMFVPLLKEILASIAPWVVMAASLLGLILFVNAAFNYINANVTGSFELRIEFVLSAVFVILSAIIGTVAVFFRVCKKEKEAQV